MDHSDRTAQAEPLVRLIVNADDFGRTPEINVAIATAHDSGIVTSASLIIGAPAARQAVALARERTSLAVGLHVVTLGGKAVLPAEAIPHLVDGDGRFPRGALSTGLRYFFSPTARLELVREMRAQFEAFRATGLPLSHVDGHHHMHLHPTVFALLLPLAAEYGARGIRVAVADELAFSLWGDAGQPLMKVGWKVAFVLLSANARRRLRRRPVPTADRVYGLMQTGHVTEDYLLRLLDRLAARRGRRRAAPPVVELFCHPSVRHESKGLGPNPGDLAAVTSPAVAARAREEGIRLTTYPEAFPVASDAAQHQAAGATGVESGRSAVTPGASAEPERAIRDD